jgi:hypothetical protein
VWTMLHWRRKVLRKSRRLLFWAKLFLFSFVAHGVFLFSILFLYKGHYFSYNVIMNTKFLHTGTSVVFMPFKKEINKQQIGQKIQRKKTIKQSRKKKSTTLASLLKRKKQIEKKTIAKKLKKKKKQAVVAQKKKIFPKENKKKTKKIAQRKHQKKVPTKKRNKSVQTVARKNKAAKAAQEQIYVGRVEMEALRMQDEMQREVSKHWSPPVGLSKDLICVLQVLVDWNGKIAETKVAQSSGVLMYDISARTAVAHMQLQKWAHGKEFNITFKQ